MHSQNNTTTPTNSSLYGFFNRVYRQLTGLINNEPELKMITPEFRPSNLDIQLPLPLVSYTPPPIHIDLTVHHFPRYEEINSFQTQTNRHSLMLQTIFSRLSSTELDSERRRAMEREMREWRSSNHEEAARWWTDVRRSQMDSELAVPLGSLNSTRLESYSNLAIDDDFICGISRDIMTNPVYDPAFPKQKYDLLVIREWLNEHETNPCTRTPLSTENLVYDEELKERIDQFVNSILTQKSCQF